jgi:uncharacterized protein YeeX (DUF496 family)
MNGLTIFYWILAIVGLLYLIGFFYCLSAVIDFSSRLKKRINALTILFSEEKDVLLSLDSYFRKAKLPYNDSDRECLSLVACIPNKNLKDYEIMDIHQTLTSLEKRFSYLCNSNAWIKQSDDYETMVSLLNDLASNYRRIVAIYNSDLTGYEYWRKQPLYRLWFFLLGFKTRRRLV